MTAVAMYISEGEIAARDVAPVLQRQHKINIICDRAWSTHGTLHLRVHVGRSSSNARL
jgi:hypothetical protein